MTGKSRTAQQVQNLDFLQILETLEHTFDGRWIFLVRSHVKVPGLQGVPDSAAILDVSKIEDMADLLLVSDFLITDYSSSAGDFALKGKPIVLYQDDRTTYEANERTFYFELGSSPFWITTNQEELIQTIQDIPNRSVEKNCRDILEFYGANETGNSSLDSAKKIADWCNCHA
jgi:CDP-glycerol glycerophosphotransferase